MTEDKSGEGWYAFRIFRNGRTKFVSKLKEDGVQYYFIEKVTESLDLNYNVVTHREPLFPSIVFVRTAAVWVKGMQRNPSYTVAPYTVIGGSEPALIPDREMEVLMFISKVSGYKLDAYEGDFTKGDHVKVIDGVFKGAEGYVLRVKGNKRFVVSIQGIAAVATSYIPQRFLEKIS